MEQEIITDEILFSKDDSIPQWRLEAKPYGMVWLDVEINPYEGCGWGVDYESNCKLTHQFVDLLQAKGLKVGIYASNYMWKTVMGSETACQDVATKVP